MATDWEADVCEIDAEAPLVDVLEQLERKGDKKEKTTGDVILGKPIPTLLNVDIILREDSRFSGRFAFDEFRLELFIDSQPASDESETGVALQIARIYGLNARTPMVREAIARIARENPFHPVREYLNSLEWDGKSRASGWLIDSLGAEDTPLHREYGERFLVGCVARIMKPGCKLDTLLVLKGPQGTGKSTAFSDLAGEDAWFCDSSIHFGNKDAFQNLHGVWIYELSELNSVRRSESSAIKAFLSSRIDRYRPPYARNPLEVPRQNVFAGTTNEEEFLKDTTGSRRFWPVTVCKYSDGSLTKKRDQLWAEAVHLYRGDTTWWLSDSGEESRGRISEQFLEIDAWEEPIRKWLIKQNGGFSIAQVLNEAINMDVDRQTTSHSMRVGKILSKFGCQKSRRLLNGKRTSVWGRSDQDAG